MVINLDMKTSCIKCFANLIGFTLIYSEMFVHEVSNSKIVNGIKTDLRSQNLARES